jgi:transitional endoplasmic reticulum ATPase
VPDVHWEDVGGLDQVKQRLIEAVEWPRASVSLVICRVHETAG